MLHLSQDFFPFFPFSASCVLSLCSLFVSMHIVLYAQLHIFFPLPHLLLNLYCLVFLFPTSHFILILYPAQIHLIISQCFRISPDFLSAVKGEIPWSHFKKQISLQPVTCTYILCLPLIFSTGVLKQSLQEPERKYLLIPYRLPSSLLHLCTVYPFTNADDSDINLSARCDNRGLVVCRCLLLLSDFQFLVKQMICHIEPSYGGSILGCCSQHVYSTLAGEEQLPVDLIKPSVVRPLRPPPPPNQAGKDFGRLEQSTAAKDNPHLCQF